MGSSEFTVHQFYSPQQQSNLIQEALIAKIGFPALTHPFGGPKREGFLIIVYGVGLGTQAHIMNVIPEMLPG